MKRVLLIFAAVFCIAAKYPGFYDGPVIDQADILDPQQEEALKNKLLNQEKVTHHQIVVATVKSLDGQAPVDYAVGMGRELGIGNKDSNDGVLVLVKPKYPDEKGEVFIATGYGAHTMVLDMDAGRITRETMVPYFKEGDMVGGINAGVDEVIRLTTPESPEAKMLRLKEEAAARQRWANTKAKIWDFFLTIFGIGAAGGTGYGLYRAATAPRRRREREEREAREEAERIAREAEEEARRKEYEKAERIRRAEARRIQEEQRKRSEAAQRAAATRRTNMLNAMTPKDRAAFLAKEQADREAAEERARIRREREEEQRRKDAEAARIRRKREEEEEEDRRRRDSYSSSSYGSSSYGSSSSSDSSSYSGGGGSFGGSGGGSSW